MLAPFKKSSYEHLYWCSYVAFYSMPAPLKLSVWNKHIVERWHITYLKRFLECLNFFITIISHVKFRGCWKIPFFEFRHRFLYRPFCFTPSNKSSNNLEIYRAVLYVASKEWTESSFLNFISCCCSSSWISSSVLSS